MNARIGQEFFEEVAHLGSRAPAVLTAPAISIPVQQQALNLSFID
jgi:hypothetical protein